MAFISWNEEFSVGIPEFDAEHRHLFDLVNDFYARLMAHRLDKEQIDAELRRLAAAVKAHFAHEEAYLERNSSPRLESHRMLHEILFSDLEVMIAESRGEGFRHLPEDMECSFLPWLVEHIRNVDKRLGV